MSVQSNKIDPGLQMTSTFRRFGMWVGKNPKTVNTLLCASIIYSVGSFLSLPFRVSSLGLSGIAVRAVSAPLIGLASLVMLLTFPILTPYRYNMKHHKYTEGSCESGELKYENDVPILRLDMKDPYKAGFAQGFLCGDAIFWLIRLSPIFLSKEIPQSVIERLESKIPEKYRKEMQGIADGCNERRKGCFLNELKVTAEEVLRLNLVVDSTYLLEEQAQTQVACTSIIEKDADGNIVFARNMDWLSLSFVGACSLVTHRVEEGNVLVSSTIGGFIGVPTGMNQHGLAIAINSCTDFIENEKRSLEERTQGMPIGFYTRACLAKCKNIADVEEFIEENPFAGPYHLIVADRDGGASFHLFQGESSYLVRKLEEGKPLITFNNPYMENGLCKKELRDFHLEDFMKDRRMRPLENALALEEVNNNRTLHSLVMRPSVPLKLAVAFDNAYSAENNLRIVEFK